MTNNQQPTAEQLVREHLEYINSGLWNDVYGTGEDFKTIFESYLSLLDELKTAKEALSLCLHELKKSNIPECIDLEEIETILNSALSKLSI